MASHVETTTTSQVEYTSTSTSSYVIEERTIIQNDVRTLIHEDGTMNGAVVTQTEVTDEHAEDEGTVDIQITKKERKITMDSQMLMRKLTEESIVKEGLLLKMEELLADRPEGTDPEAVADGSCAMDGEGEAHGEQPDEEGDRWVNCADDNFKTYCGEDIFNRERGLQFDDAQKADDGLFSEVGLKLKKKKMNMLYQTDAVAQSGKACHPKSVGGAGFASVVNNPKFPPHEFFRPKRVFRIRLRHCNYSLEDDAALDGRVACIKFCDNDKVGPLDLILHTGRVASFHNAVAYKEFLDACENGTEKMKEWTLAYPYRYYGRVENLRRAPNSYYDQRYYSQCTYTFMCKDGKERYARVRLLPADASAETGLPSKVDQKKIWDTSRLPGDDRKPDYLRKEYVERMRQNPLQYRLQIQIHEWKDGDSKAIFNPAKSWKIKTHPWLDLAIITVAFPLTDDLIARTRLSLMNSPESFSLPEVSSSHDFNSLGFVRSEIHGNVDKSSLKNTAEEEEEDAPQKTTYVVSVVTGMMGDAGTDADIYITITGMHGRTKPMYLDNRFHDDFEAGHVDVFEIKGRPVGDILTVQMDLKSKVIRREWFLAYVTVLDVAAQRSVKCPCYRWLTSDQPTVILRRAEALLSQHETLAYCYLQRKFELEERRQAYQWQHVKGMPGRLKAERFEDLPQDARFHSGRRHELRSNYMKALTNIGVGSFRSLLEPWGNFSDFKQLVTDVICDGNMVSRVATHWKSDAEFGRQCLNGIHPTQLRQMGQIPPNLNIQKDTLDGLLDRGKSIQEEIKDGHVYVANYPDLADLECHSEAKGKDQRYLCAPLCVFYVNQAEELVPIAIQLSQSPEDSKIWTPLDEENDWLFAKMCVRVADMHMHLIGSRQLYGLLVMEALTIATLRNLPTMHPIFKLLVPHLRYCLAVNALYREYVLCPGGWFDDILAIGNQHGELIKRLYRKFKLSKLDLPRDLEMRGVVDKEGLPNYFYRDDGLELWRVVKKYLRTVLMLQYPTDSDVQADEELQAWIMDIHINGFPQYEEDVDHEVPSSFKIIDEVIDFLTLVVFTASCRHAALNNGLMDYCSFVPNYPTMLFQAPPTEKGKATVESLMNALPSRSKSGEVIAALYTMSAVSKDEKFLGEYPDEHFCGEAMLACIEAFGTDLQYTSDIIHERNKDLEFPYTYFLPERIPNSVTA